MSFLAVTLPPEIKSYDPLLVPDPNNVVTLDLTVHDEERQREIPLRICLPSQKSPSPVILFSHGLGGSREGYAYLAKHWASRGYVVVFLQHPGSNDSVWKDVPKEDRLRALTGAASLQNFLLRVKDVLVVLDQLDEWNKSEDHALYERCDLRRVGMAGHSFGAITTQAVSGQATALRNLAFNDSRIKAAIAMSPSSPRRGLDPQQAFAKVKIPWMLMTGTKDLAVIGEADLASRLAVFPALPPGGKYEVVFFGAEHSAFSDRPLPGDTEKRNPNHHRAILALSTAFWDAWLSEDPLARAWLDGARPQSVLEKGDRWQRK
ncbi:MAG: alpha/beta fold hydrolase [Terriglobia bacterium]